MKTLPQLLAQYASIAENIRNELSRKITAIPDNPDVTRLGNGCFSVKASAIFASPNINLLPEHYDFERQKEMLQSVLSNGQELDVQIRKLREIAETGKVKISSGHGMSYTFTFHERVISALREMLKAADGGMKTEKTLAYYAVLISDADRTSIGARWVCIKGCREPDSIEEVEAFMRKTDDLIWFSNCDHVLEFEEIDEETAHEEYDLSDEAYWPIFGGCDE